ncbi:hypothetical protein [Sphingomonas sp.]|uniref:hypothetical protein n=1 Tax=Sphingomonas sp. TaxID=28214 RepID=UPI0035C7CB42
MNWRGLLSIACGLLLAPPAAAEWMRAETPHFVVYEEASAAEVRKLAVDLERFDGFVRLFHAMRDAEGARSNKVTVYVVSDVGAVQRLCGKCANVAGFYDGRASGSVAFTPRRTAGGYDGAMRAQTILFHEYAHHFLLGNYAVAYPAWFSEGYAEFVSTMTIKDKVTIGVAAQHRGRGLFTGPEMPATMLFDPGSRRKLSPEQMDVLYGRGWLMTHWIMFDEARRAKFKRYLDLLNSGTPSLKAATEAFGDLKELDRTLNRYVRQSRIPGMVLDLSMVPEPVVQVAALSPGAEAMIPFRLVSTRGVNRETAASLYRKAAAVAPRFPNDPVVQGWFAEIAFDAGEHAAADAAADRAIAADPRSAQALIYKALVAMAQAEKDPEKWKAARSLIIRANRLDPDYAYPLVLFYASFEREGRPPVASAVAGLHRALELVPQDDGVRFLAARQLIRDGDLKAARKALGPLAYNPHLPPDNPAAKALAALDGGDGAAALAVFEGEAKTEPTPAG